MEAGKSNAQSLNITTMSNDPASAPVQIAHEAKDNSHFQKVVVTACHTIKLPSITFFGQSHSYPF